MKIQFVNSDYVHQVWPKVVDYIASALEYQTDYTIDHAQASIAAGTWTLIVACDDDNFIHGAATVQFINRPKDRVAFVIAMGGRLISSQDTYLQFKDVLRSFGATYIEGAARESIARLWSRYGFEEKYRIVGAHI